MKVINVMDIPSTDDESKSDLTIIQIENPEIINELEEDYKSNYLQFKDYVLEYLGVGEEHNVMAGAAYTRYELSILNDLIFVYGTLSYNI